MFTLAQADKIVDRNFFLRWNGWDIELIDPTKNGYNKPQGVFYNEQWCTMTTIKPNKEGLYAIPAKYSRVIRTAKH